MATYIDQQQFQHLTITSQCLAYLYWRNSYVSQTTLKTLTGSANIRQLMGAKQREHFVTRNNHGAWKLAAAGQRWCAMHLSHVIHQQGESV
jgi:hypothetical protein